MKEVLFITPIALALAAVVWLLLKKRSRHYAQSSCPDAVPTEKPVPALPPNDEVPTAASDLPSAEYAPSIQSQADTSLRTLPQSEATTIIDREQQITTREPASNQDQPTVVEDYHTEVQTRSVASHNPQFTLATDDVEASTVYQPCDSAAVQRLAVPTINEEAHQATPPNRSHVDAISIAATAPEDEQIGAPPELPLPELEAAEAQGPQTATTGQTPCEKMNARHESRPAHSADPIAELEQQPPTNERAACPSATVEKPTTRILDTRDEANQTSEAPPSDDKRTQEVEPVPAAPDEARPDSNRKKIIQLHTTDQPARKPDRPKRSSVLPPRERAPKIYAAPDISECAVIPADAYRANEWLDYRKWNRALSSFFLLYSNPGSAACLTVTPRLLAAAWQKAEGTALTPEEASTNFSNAVGALYRRQVLTHPEGLRILKCSAPDDAPLGTALLGLAVLAAYTMHTEGGTSANAYYARLADLLVAHHESTDSLPLDQDEYYALWAYVRHWLQQRTGAALPLPAREDSTRFYVSLALFHAPLRQVDIERLPRFFISAKYGPGEKPASHELDATLRHWCAGRTRFTEAGSAALSDERRPAVLAQIAHELEAWDGTGHDEEGQTNANIDLQLTFRNRQPVLSYLAKCPPGFPRAFHAPTRLLSTAEGGWYEPAAVSTAEGAALTDGFTWQFESRGTAFALRRPAAKAIAFALREQQGSSLISQNGLPVRAKCAAMCLDSLAPATSQYLSALCGRQCTGLKPAGFPEGWTLFVGLNVINTNVPTPDHLEPLAPDPSIQILYVGGLKAGGAYLMDAPPTICITGTSNNIRVNDQPATVDDNGCIVDPASLLAVGRPNTISAENRNRKLELVDSDLAPRLTVHPSAPRSKNATETLFAAPAGAWHILGPTVGDIGEPIQARREGTLFLCKFQPVWAICTESRVRPKIVVLHDRPPPPEKLLGPILRKIRSQRSFRKYAARWASTIRFANHPLARIVSADGAEASQNVRELWAKYKRAAREAARHLRRR